MQKITFITLALTLITACTNPAKKEEAAPAPKDYFANTRGCFLLYNMKTNAFEKVIGEENCRERLVACSTFKVPLAVMAFDAKVLKDENQVLKWDGIKGDREVLNHDHDAKTWMRDSVVWFSQRITPKLGEKKFKKYLHAFKYGNEDISAGIKTAWLVSPSAKSSALKVSAYEQAEFLRNLWTDSLPVSKRAMSLAREITYLETSPKGFKMNGKTGSNYYDQAHKQALGWFISHIQNGDQEYITVANFSDVAPLAETSYGGPRAKDITKQILTDMGLW